MKPHILRRSGDFDVSSSRRRTRNRAFYVQIAWLSEKKSLDNYQKATV
jgi:hypothetical protein